MKNLILPHWWHLLSIWGYNTKHHHRCRMLRCWHLADFRNVFTKCCNTVVLLVEDWIDRKPLLIGKNKDSISMVFQYHSKSRCSSLNAFESSNDLREVFFKSLRLFPPPFLIALDHNGHRNPSSFEQNFVIFRVGSLSKAFLMVFMLDYQRSTRSRVILRWFRVFKTFCNSIAVILLMFNISSNVRFSMART